MKRFLSLLLILSMAFGLSAVGRAWADEEKPVPDNATIDAAIYLDYAAGPAALGKAAIAEQGEELFRYILDVASGRRQPYSEQYRWHNDICIFNPAPIT